MPGRLERVVTPHAATRLGIPGAAPRHRLLTPWRGIARRLGPQPAGLAPLRPSSPSRTAAAGGVRLQVRPLTTVVLAAAEAHAERLIRRLAQDRADRLEAGLATGDLPDLENADVRGLARALLARTLAVHGTLAWEGVVWATTDEDAAPEPAGEAEPADLTEANLAELMAIPVVAQAFLARYTAPLDALFAEGNGSGAAPAGTGAATAPSAASTTVPAPAASPATPSPSAPTSSTRRGPSRASSSGTS